MWNLQKAFSLRTIKMCQFEIIDGVNNVYCIKHAYKFLLREQVGFAAVLWRLRQCVSCFFCNGKLKTCSIHIQPQGNILHLCSKGRVPTRSSQYVYYYTYIHVQSIIMYICVQLLHCTKAPDVIIFLVIIIKNNNIYFF